MCMLEKTTKKQPTKQKPLPLWADISEMESNAAKALAKSLGYSYQGWLGQLIKRELISAGVASAPPMQPTYLSGTAIKEGNV